LPPGSRVDAEQFDRARDTEPGTPQVRFHDLRHVARVYAAEAGATLPKLMARLGHATPAAALVYLHARSDRDNELTDALSKAMTL
jgi:integrase